MQEQEQQPEPRRRTGWRKALIGAAVAVALAVPVASHFLSPSRIFRDASVAATQPSARVQRLAQFGAEPVSTDVRRFAHWVADSRDNKTMNFVVIDKKDAKVYLFDREARLQTAVPALMGSYRGDDTAPGVGDKPIAEVLPHEKTTPAGRFVAEVGQSSSRGEDVVWIDYDAAVSMHRIIKAPERLASLASPDVNDNRMSFGCVNLPDAFYEKSLRPAVDNGGVVVYVLPETKTLKQTFAAYYDVNASQKLAQH